MLGMIVANIEFMMICIYLFVHALFSHCLFTSLLDMFSLRKSVSGCLSVSSPQNFALNLLDLPRSHVFIPFQSSKCDCLEIAFLNFAMTFMYWSADAGLQVSFDAHSQAVMHTGLRHRYNNSIVFADCMVSNVIALQ